MKAALLVSLAYRPELVVLDEPFSGLDPLARDELIRALLELTGEHNWTTLISSHDIDEVERLADSIAFIDNGRIFITESVQDLIGKYRRPLREIFVMLARQSREHAQCAEARMNSFFIWSAGTCAASDAAAAVAAAGGGERSCSRARGRHCGRDGSAHRRWALLETCSRLRKCCSASMFIALVVQEHPLVGTSAFWMTRADSSVDAACGKAGASWARPLIAGAGHRAKSC